MYVARRTLRDMHAEWQNFRRCGQRKRCSQVIGCSPVTISADPTCGHVLALAAKSGLRGDRAEATSHAQYLGFPWSRGEEGKTSPRQLAAITGSGEGSADRGDAVASNVRDNVGVEASS